MGGFVCASHRRKNKGIPTLKRTLNLGIEKGRLLKNSRPKGGLIQVVCYPTSPETVDITGFFEKFCIAIRTKRFIKNLKRLNAAERAQLKKKLEILEMDPLYPSLRTKRIQGTVDLFEFSVNMDVRVIWQYDGDTIILLLDIGHHDILNQF